MQGRIQFRDVCFAYAAGQEAVLRDINLSIAPGRTVALVGPSGGGKSTLASLLSRFREADSGQVLIDGLPVGEYDRANLRSQIALVSQQVTLFNDTLRANIAYGALAGAEAGALEEAVRRAHADGFISRLPKGLDTVVGHGGITLSGGERQRIAIARALLKDAPILILDEATSALDTESERQVQAALDEVMHGRTTIVIAHRLSTVEKADLICVLDQGRIVERGDHAALLANGGLYANLHDAGLQGSQEPAAEGAARSEPAAPIRPAAGAVSPLVRAWRRGAWWVPLLAPAAWLFGLVVKRRRLAVLTGRAPPWRAPAPVIVVGGLTVGGVGKTPLVIWLAQWLKERGLRPGVVSRGYGGRGNRRPLRVPAEGADPAQCGDEPVLIALRTGCPVVVCRDRVRAVQALLADGEVDVVITDDGLQHYRLARDLEVAVIDGQLGFGNGRLLPAGPLREPASRLAEVDWVVCNGRRCGAAAEEALMVMRPTAFVNLHSGLRLAPAEFTKRHRSVHGVAGIGNPDRFLHALRSLGLQVQPHWLDDHHVFTGKEVLFADELPVVCTDKDAVKLSRLPTPVPQCWRLQVAADIDAAGLDLLQRALKRQAILP